MVKELNKKSVNKVTSHYGIIILDNNHSREVSFLIVNKLKNCCNDCVHCEIVTETKRRAIPENKHYPTEGLCTALRITTRDE